MRLSGLTSFSLGLLAAGAAAAAPLQGSEWKPERVHDVAVPADSAAFVQFRSKGRLQGHGGCNRLFAEYEAADGQIFIGPVAATRMACDEEVMQRESALALALETARTYHRQQTRLVLFDAGGRPIAELRQTDWD